MQSNEAASAAGLLSSFTFNTIFLLFACDDIHVGWFCSRLHCLMRKNTGWKTIDDYLHMWHSIGVDMLTVTVGKKGLA